MKTTLFIVDDHYMVIEGIQSLLKNEAGIDCIGYAMNAASCQAFLTKQLPDVILMDINLPDKSGIELCKEVLQTYPQLRILGLSSFNQKSYIKEMMANGAMGYLPKNASKDEILQAVATVMKGDNYLSFEMAALLRQPQPAAIILTKREQEVLQLIAQGKTNKDIAEQLFVSPTTVDTHRKNLLQKFDAKNTASLIMLAGKAGLL